MWYKFSSCLFLQNKSSSVERTTAESFRCYCSAFSYYPVLMSCNKRWCVAYLYPKFIIMLHDRWMNTAVFLYTLKHEKHSTWSESETERNEKLNIYLCLDLFSRVFSCNNVAVISSKNSQHGICGSSETGGYRLYHTVLDPGKPWWGKTGKKLHVCDQLWPLVQGVEQLCNIQTTLP